METLKKVHELIKEINGVAGGVLFYVLPLLSEELKVCFLPFARTHTIG